LLSIGPPKLSEWQSGVATVHLWSSCAEPGTV
jgi:hypothetical protein